MVGVWGGGGRVGGGGDGGAVTAIDYARHIRSSGRRIVAACSLEG